MRFSPRIKNEVIDVVVPCHVCATCNNSLMDSKQLNVFRKTAADKYREKNGLLTSKQIIKYRENLGMSQTAFADFLNVGDASIKRWETYYVQDSSQDDHIRLKCDEKYAEMNLLILQWKYWRPDIFTGEKKFSVELFRSLDTHFLKLFPESKQDLTTLHFYSDFLHFKRYNVGITGNRYVPFRYGPNPYQYKSTCKVIETLQKPKKDLSVLEDNERKTVDYICEIYCKIGGEALHDLANKESGYLQTNDSEFISYKFSNNLLI